MMSPEQQYLGEFVASAVLILLGDGVVAGVALGRSRPPAPAGAWSPAPGG
ncbi:hypothetical protein [Lysobacter enzymogenes]|nr:hypothetical protein [Lysobacter enzymogenes]UZW62189.1 hypothetical protein BV903_007845 [Lysobacter enzymogenes]